MVALGTRISKKCPLDADVEAAIMIERRRFLLALRAPSPVFEPLERALLSIGGVARGAYEAGIVGAPARGRGFVDYDWRTFRL